jgi:fatty-acyl-CoA synthase
MPDSLINFTPSAYRYPLLIKQLLHAPLTQAADQEIVYRDLKRYTYRDLNQRIARLANALTAAGVEHGDAVGVLDWDSHRYLESYFAIPMMGATLMTVNVRLSPEQVLFTVNHARPKVLLVNTEFLSLVEPLLDQLESVEGIILLTDDGAVAAAKGKVFGEYEALLAAASPEREFKDFDEDTRATMFYTTGTTGQPKGVYFSHRQLVLHALIDLVAFGTPAVQGRFHREDVYMPITPMFHVHGWGLPYAATAMGVKQVYPGRYAPDFLLHLIKTEGVTFSHCVPTILQMLLTHPASKDVDLSELKMVIGGSALTKALAKAAMERGIDIFAGYGMSESGPILTVAQLSNDQLELSVEEQAELRVKTGTPVPLVDFRVVDGGMKNLPHDGKTPGEIVVRSPWLTMGYLNNPKASETLWDGGYLHTGDIGTMTKSGVVQITDRIKDVIKTGGEWISSIELEDILMQMPQLSEAAIIGIADAKWGERPLALLVPKNGGALDKKDVQAHVKSFVDRGIISRFAIPDAIMFIDALDKTSVGKIDKKALRAKYGDG